MDFFKLSIVMPVYNERETIKETSEAVFSAMPYDKKITAKVTKKNL